MSPDLIMLFSFMACTLALGLFLGWALWRFDNEKEVSDESQADFWKKSFDKSRLELWHLQQKYTALEEKMKNGPA
jgi:hypothetical protein